MSVRVWILNTEHEQHQDRRHAQDQRAQLVQSALEGRGRLLRAQRGRNSPETGSGSSRDHQHGDLTADQRRSAEQGIERFRGVSASLGSGRFSTGNGFPGQQSLVRVGCLALDDNSVGRNELACPRHHDVVGNDLLDRQSDRRSVAPGLGAGPLPSD